MFRERLKGRLVFAYALDGVRPGAQAGVELTLRDGKGVVLGAWSRLVDRGDPQKLERVWFPLASGLLAQVQDAIQADLSIDGAAAHSQRYEIQVGPFRSDGTLVDGARPATPDGPGLGLAQAFFGLVARHRRRRRGDPGPSS